MEKRQKGAGAKERFKESKLKLYFDQRSGVEPCMGNYVGIRLVIYPVDSTPSINYVGIKLVIYPVDGTPSIPNLLHILN